MNDKRTEPIFNTVVDIYDNVKALRANAERLVVYAKLSPGQRVLDVACGTGWSTMAAARVVGNTGKVIGIDIADKMLDLARRKAASAGLSNIEYRLGDAQALEFNDASFDAVICASSIFLLKDIPKALLEWRRVLKTGGTVVFSRWGDSFLQPMIKMFHERLASYGGKSLISQQPRGKTDMPDEWRELLKRAGFEKIKIITEQLGSYIQDATAYWQEASDTILRLSPVRLSPNKLEKFKAEHLAEVEALRTVKGIWIDLPGIFSIAKKPSV